MISFFKKRVNTHMEKNYKNLEMEEYITKLKKLSDELTEKDNQISYIQEDYKNIFNLFSDILIVIDVDGYVIDLNNKAKEFLSKLYKGAIIGENWKNIVEYFGCDWAKSIEKQVMENNINKELSKEIYIKPFDKHLLISVMPINRSQKKNKVNYFIFVGRDITQTKQREIELIKKHILMSAVEKITHVFSKNININYIMERVVDILMNSVWDIDVCYVYKNCVDVNGYVFTEKFKESTVELVKINEERGKLDTFYYKDLFPRWEEYFNINHIVCGTIDDFPKNERQTLSEVGIKSLCAVPIYTPHCTNGLWGFIGFNSYNKKKEWSYDEEAILKVAAHVTGAGIYQWGLRNNENEILQKSCLNL